MSGGKEYTLIISIGTRPRPHIRAMREADYQVEGGDDEDDGRGDDGQREAHARLLPHRLRHGRQPLARRQLLRKAALRRRGEPGEKKESGRDGEMEKMDREGGSNEPHITVLLPDMQYILRKKSPAEVNGKNIQEKPFL